MAVPKHDASPQGHSVPLAFPAIPGHEIAGSVEQIGAGAPQMWQNCLEWFTDHRERLCSGEGETNVSFW